MGSEGNILSQLEHWKKQAENYKRSLDEVHDQFNEFQSDSKALEEELEKQLDILEQKNKELLSANEKLTREKDSLKEKYDSVQADFRGQVCRLETELSQVTCERDNLGKYIRELEQANDDLDRAKRNAVCSLEEFERKLNDAIERNVMLESELDDKDALKVNIQRLKEEARDLKSELSVRELREKVVHSLPPSAGGWDKMENGPLPPFSSVASPSSATKTPKGVVGPKSGIPRSVTVDGSSGGQRLSSGRATTPLTPSARISALNIVGDLLRKVGALESKLASCRRYAANSNLEDTPSGPQAKQLHLSTSNANLGSGNARNKQPKTKC